MVNSGEQGAKMNYGRPKRTHSKCCEAELIITPAYPVKERVVVCCSCGCPDDQTSVRQYLGRGI